MIVKHFGGSYPIGFCRLADAMSKLPEDAAIITDHHVSASLDLPARSSLPRFEVTPGESSKSIAQFEECVRWLVQIGASRKTAVIGIGGGVVGDLAGFAASACLRGIPFIQVPTTLLAQVDSAIGGKVGVDLPEGKNLVGAFYPPKSVFICSDVLGSLPQRQFRNGMAEVLKYGFILDRDLLARVPEGLTADNGELVADIVRRCLELKAKVVAKDEFETTGLRAVLNYGHTVGHAIEHATGYGEVLHGEAISIGMTVEARLGEAIGITEAGVSAIVAESLARQGLPITHPILKDGARLVEAMRRDKKATHGKLAFSLLSGIGACKLVKDVSEDAVLNALSIS